MEKLIEEIKGMIQEKRNNFFKILFLFFLLNSCANMNIISKRKTIIEIGSFMDSDTINLIINDSLILSQKVIIKNDYGFPSVSLIQYGSKLNVHLTHSGLYKTPFRDIKRKIKLDTIIDSSNGRYVMINVGLKKIDLHQQNKKWIID